MPPRPMIFSRGLSSMTLARAARPVGLAGGVQVLVGDALGILHGLFLGAHGRAAADTLRPVAVLAAALLPPLSFG